MIRFLLSPSAHSSRLKFSLALSCALVACQHEKQGTAPGDRPVAKVNGTTITQADVDMAAKRSLGDLAIGSIERIAYPRLIQAAVRSRAISTAAEKEQSAADKQALERELSAYREQLLVRQYLNRHYPPKPVTAEMALDYYNHYPERFGAGSERQYEILGATRGLSMDERTRMLEKLSEGAKKTDWKAWAEELQKAGLPVTFLTSSSVDSLLHAKLRTLLDGLKSGTPSSVVFVEGRAYVGRLSAETNRPPKPFDTVREQIERLLAPAQVSAAIERAAEDVLKDAKVEILTQPEPSSSALPPGAKKP
jgi:hypothetical protein